MSPIHVSVFGSSQTGPEDPHYLDARRLGRLLASRGYAVVNGGYGGLMEAVSAGAAAAGGEVIGVTAPQVFPGRSGANQYLTVELPATDLISRIGKMLEISDAAIALTGSIGTLTELVMTWNLNYVAPFSGRRPIPLIAVGEPWTGLIPLLTERVSTNGDLVTLVDDIDAAIARLDEHVSRT
jgi:uncharacterized protein (TIGR00730 family)